MADKKIKDSYDYVVIGGGIVGAGILRDLALHNQNVLLIEKEDFSSQTSGGSSKMLHGGIRYLENFDFLLVFEALREKKIWLKLASHISKERVFYLPVYKESKWPLFLMKIGLFIYDLLSLFRNKPYKSLNSKDTLKQLPGLKSDGLKGSGVYSDGVIDDSKLVFDLIFDSIYHGADAINYTELLQIEKNQNHYNLTLQNNNNFTKNTIEAKNIIFAVGPFTDQVMQRLEIPWDNIILPSKGSHIWLKKDSLPITESLVIQTKDKRVIFVIPQQNSILVGTTEVKLDEKDKFNNLSPSRKEIDYLLDSVNNYFPDAKINENHIIAQYAAVRPLVKEGTNADKTSRNHKIYEPMENVFVIAGGKYTTFRVMAKDVCKKLFKKDKIKYNKKLSQQEFTKKSLLYDIHSQKITKELLQEIIKKEQVHNMEDLIRRRLSVYSLEQIKNSNEIEDQLKDIKI